MTTTLYPLRFEPLLQRYIWGGRRLGEVLGKPIGAETCAESWEICDHGEHQSVVRFGTLAGASLHSLVQDYGEELLGPGRRVDPSQFGPDDPRGRFPLLLKFLDAAKTLSVQVHPDDRLAALLDPPDLGKTEAWVVLAAEPGSRIYAGLRPGTDRQALAAAIAEGRCEELLHQFQPAVGDCLFIAAGTVHALGEGLLVAEIQQSSNTTYRLFDWNRLGTDGRPRPLHVEAGQAATDFARGPVDPLPPRPLGQPGGQRLVECDKFLLDRWRLAQPSPLGSTDSCHLVSVLEGSVRVAGDPSGETLVRGDTILLPASAGAVEFRPHEGEAVLLDAHLA